MLGRQYLTNLLGALQPLPPHFSLPLHTPGRQLGTYPALHSFFANAFYLILFFLSVELL